MGVEGACDTFALLATICALDPGMGNMRGCRNYKSLCARGTVVQQCATVTGLTFLPTTDEANDQTRAICEEMYMDGCELCQPGEWWDTSKMWVCPVRGVWVV